MGLDMYLTKQTYISKYDFDNWEDKTKDPPRNRVRVIGVPGIKTGRVTCITEEMGYWRKANAIHGWFVDNVQNGEDDCKEYYVSEEKIKELLELVNKVLKNPNKASTLLPSRKGFFFGSSDYDEWYIKDLESTKEILEACLKEKDGDFYYQSSW